MYWFYNEYMNTADCKSRQTEVNDYDRPFQPYAQPVHLPLLPQYDIDVPDQEGKLFGGVAATRYETIIVRETVRPVCLFVDGNVPPCDHHIHNNYNNHPKEGTARRPTNVDYESYFIEPSKPDVKIEITEIPFKGTYVLTGTTAEPDEEHAAGGGPHHATPPMADRPVAEDVRERRTAARRGGRQLLQTALGAAGTAIVAGLGANAAGLVTNAGGQLLQQGGGGGVGGLAGAVGGGLAAAVGHGGNRNQVTMYVTRVDKVLDDRVTVTLVPKNCVPDAGQVHALRPCAGAGYRPYAAPGQAYHHHQTHDDDGDDREEPQRPPPHDVAADIVSQVDGLVREMVGSRTNPVVATPAGHGHRYRVTAAAAAGPF